MRRARAARSRRLAEDAHGAGSRPLEPEDQPQERRLAAAVRAGDRDELPRRDLEGDVLQHRDARPVGERDVAELDGADASGMGHVASEGVAQGGEIVAHDGEVVCSALRSRPR